MYDAQECQASLKLSSAYLLHRQKAMKQCHAVVSHPRKFVFCSFTDSLKVPVLRLLDTDCKRKGTGDRQLFKVPYWQGRRPRKNGKRRLCFLLLPRQELLCNQLWLIYPILMLKYYHSTCV